MNTINLSVSQLKSFNASKAQWAGKYILWLKDEYKDDALILGQLAEIYLFTGKDDFKLLEGKNLNNKDKLLEEYENIKHNAIWLEFTKWDVQRKVKGNLLGMPFIGYIDNHNPNLIDDIKTVKYLTNIEDVKENRNFWSWLSTYEEYELQMWVYMKLSNIKKARVIEVSKHRYKDGKNAHQFIHFELTEEMDKRMLEKWAPIVAEIQYLYDYYISHGFIQENSPTQE